MQNTSRVELKVNGREVARDVEPRMHLGDFLREELLLTATHLGCEQGVCGACTVMKDGRPVRACLTLAVACDGAEIHTLEGLDDDALMARLRQAFKQHHGLQCGFCTPGMLATGYDIVRRLPDADETRVRKELSGNLCRCTGYQGAVNAIRHVLSEAHPPASLVAGTRSRPKAANVPVGVDVARAAQPASSGLEIPDRIDNGIRLTRTLQLKAPVERVRDLLQDIPAVVDCIPGAQLEGPPDGDQVRGFVGVAIGPIQARFEGIARVRYADDGQGGRIIGRGQDRLSRSRLDGVLDYTLRENGARETQIELEMTYRLEGLLAQVGRPAIVQEIADRLLDQTAGRLAAKANGTLTEASRNKPLSGVSLLIAVFRGLIARLVKSRRTRS